MNLKDVEKLAELARIELTDKEKKEILSDMDSILGYVKQIETVSVGNVETDYKLHNVWKEDLPAVAVEKSFSNEIIVKQFPDSKDGFLKVKKIL